MWKSKKSEKSEKSKMSNRQTFEFAAKVRKSTIRELQASRRERLVQLAHKTYEPARVGHQELAKTREKAIKPYFSNWAKNFA